MVCQCKLIISIQYSKLFQSKACLFFILLFVMFTRGSQYNNKEKYLAYFIIFFFFFFAYILILSLPSATSIGRQPRLLLPAIFSFLPAIFSFLPSHSLISRQGKLSLDANFFVCSSFPIAHTRIISAGWPNSLPRVIQKFNGITTIINTGITTIINIRSWVGFFFFFCFERQTWQ